MFSQKNFVSSCVFSFVVIFSQPYGFSAATKVMSPPRAAELEPATRTPDGSPARPAKNSPWKTKVTPGGSKVVVRTNGPEVVTRSARRLLIPPTPLDLSSDEGLSKRLFDGDVVEAGEGAPVSPRILHTRMAAASSEVAKDISLLFGDVSSDAAVVLSSLNVNDSLRGIIDADCALHKRDFDAFQVSLKAALDSDGTDLEEYDLHPMEVAYWESRYVSCLFRVPARMPYRVCMRVAADRAASGDLASPSYNGKNKGRVSEHAISYELICKVLTSPETTVYKIAQYKSDLRTEDEIRRGVSADDLEVVHPVLEFHYPVMIELTASATSPVGGVARGPREAVISFKESRESLRARLDEAKTEIDFEGRMLPYLDCHYNQLFHACYHKRAPLEGREEVSVVAVEERTATGRPCLGFREI